MDKSLDFLGVNSISQLKTDAEVFLLCMLLSMPNYLSMKENEINLVRKNRFHMYLKNYPNCDRQNHDRFGAVMYLDNLNLNDLKNLTGVFDRIRINSIYKESSLIYEDGFYYTLSELSSNSLHDVKCEIKNLVQDSLPIKWRVDNVRGGRTKYSIFMVSLRNIENNYLRMEIKVQLQY